MELTPAEKDAARRPPAGTMSLSEITYWLTRLLTEPQMGWWFAPDALRKCLRLKLNRDPTAAEQIYASQQLHHILAGDLICKPCIIRGRQTGMVVVADEPQPLAVQPKKAGFVAVGPNGVKLRLGEAPFEAPVKQMPDFKDVFKRAG